VEVGVLLWGGLVLWGLRWRCGDCRGSMWVLVLCCVVLCCVVLFVKNYVVCCVVCCVCVVCVLCVCCVCVVCVVYVFCVFFLCVLCGVFVACVLCGVSPFSLFLSYLLFSSSLLF